MSFLYQGRKKRLIKIYIAEPSVGAFGNRWGFIDNHFSGSSGHSTPRKFLLHYWKGFHRKIARVNKKLNEVDKLKTDKMATLDKINDKMKAMEKYKGLGSSDKKKMAAKVGLTTWDFGTKKKNFFFFYGKFDLLATPFLPQLDSR